MFFFNKVTKTLIYVKKLHEFISLFYFLKFGFLLSKDIYFLHVSQVPSKRFSALCVVVYLSHRRAHDNNVVAGKPLEYPEKKTQSFPGISRETPCLLRQRHLTGITSVNACWRSKTEQHFATGGLKL